MAPLSKQLLEVLRCPLTGSPLVERDGFLVAVMPGKAGELSSYRVEEGIPVMLHSEPSPDGQAGTAKAPGTEAPGTDTPAQP